MTRKEEILNKAIEFVDKCYVNVGIKTTHEASVAACQDIAEWADKTMIDRVCEWLEDNIYDYLYINRDFNEADYKYGFIEDLRKAVEE